MGLDVGHVLDGPMMLPRDQWFGIGLQYVAFAVRRVAPSAGAAPGLSSAYTDHVESRAPDRRVLDARATLQDRHEKQKGVDLNPRRCA